MQGFVWCPHCGSPHALGSTRCPSSGQALAPTHSGARGLARGTLIAGRYKLRTLVGDEGVALLYDASQLGLRRRVLLELVHRDEGTQAEREAKALEMEREARAASSIEHPNVAEVLDFGRTGEGEAFLVRHWSSRARLSTTLRTSGALDEGEAGDILAEILSGLSAIHRAGIVHRDLDPHNIAMIQREGCRPLARIRGLGHCSGPKLDAPRGLPPGVRYISPELLLGAVVDERSDLFSCGVILFEMLTGRRPFGGDSEAETQQAIVRGQRLSAAKLAPQLGQAWLDVLDKALHVDPAQRFRSALDLQAALPTHARPTRLRAPADDRQRTVPGMAPTVDLANLTGDPSRPGASGGGTSSDPWIGRTLANKYAMEELLGSGSAGAVYRAMHVDLQRPVAVKVLHHWNLDAPQFVERFRAEGLGASRLDHPNLTRVLDCGQDSDGTLYIVMEYVDGQSLSEVLATHGRLSPVRAVAIALQIVSSLAHAHDAGVIHRDIKPENIMLLVARGDDGEPVDHAKLCDFGLAKRQDTSGPALTGTGMLLGSPSYMAPEQIRGLPCDARTDIYAAGVTLFELLTGRLPHEAEAMESLFMKKLLDPPTRPSALVDDGSIDPLLEDIIMHALELDPAQRHASARALRSELAEVLEQMQAPDHAHELTLDLA